MASDLKYRLKEHNAGKARHTRNYRPWDLKFYAAFISRTDAARFEKYLKSGSGHAFANKRLWPTT
jgi:predicted GIY-YIG superfamily endonuclease